MNNLERLRMRQAALRESCRQKEEDLSSRLAYFSKNYPSILFKQFVPDDKWQAGLSSVLGIVARIISRRMGAQVGGQADLAGMAYEWLESKISGFFSRRKGKKQEESPEDEAGE